MEPKTQLCPCCGKIMSADYDYDSYDGWFYTCLKWSKSWLKWLTCADAQDYAVNDVYYKAYVPEGSVDQSFNVDLQ